MQDDAMAKKYKAIEVAAPGNLRIVEGAIPEPGQGQVLIRVEACGICHTDSLTVEGQFPGLSLPRVPGHEVVGRIEAIGKDDSQIRPQCLSLLALRSEPEQDSVPLTSPDFC
jgi:D-arabinose 1-dehydrogenase-like Zn-dependent alcohol dehydrogenase